MDPMDFCDLAICPNGASDWFLNPEVDHIYSICNKFDIDHARKRTNLEHAGFKELPGKPSRDEVKIARVMLF